MKQLITLMAFVLCTSATGQQRKFIDSKIDKVTVFLEAAQVQRSAKTSLTSGKHELVFTGISPSINKQSIQVKADGNLTVLSVIHQHNYMREQQKQEEIREIEVKKEALLEKIGLEKNILHVYKQEETMLIKNQQIGGANNGLKTIDLKEAADFQRSRLTEVYQKQMETERTIKKKEAELNTMTRQLTELNQQADISTSEILVSVQTKETTNSNFLITYLVNDAGWFPTYDIRVKDIVSPINLQYKANVFQSSGEDWKEVKLFLSTGNPNESGTKPVLNAWYLRYNYAFRQTATVIQGSYLPGVVSGVITDESGSILPGATIMIRGTRNGVAADHAGQFRIKASPGDVLVVSGAGLETTEVPVDHTGFVNLAVKRTVLAGAEVVVTALGYQSDDRDMGYSVTGKDHKKKKEEYAVETKISYQPTTTVYEIEDPYTILNNGKTYMVDIDGYEVNAQFEYYAAPKLEPDAFLTAKVADWQELNLLPGEANLFFEGTFLGKSALDLENAGDTLQLSLGKDKSVQVKRSLLKEFSSKRFIGSNRTDTRKYEIVVRNNKQQPIRIILVDQFPVTTQKEIEVKEREYDGAKLDDDTQVLTWQFNVDPRKDNKVNFKYEVKYPKEKLLILD